MRLRSLLAFGAALGFASAAAPAATAQVPFIPQFGVLGGVNFASLSDATTAAGDASLDGSTGFHIGAFAELGVGPLGVRPAVMFVKAGAIEEPGADDFETSYIAVPVDLRYSPLPTPFVKPYVLVGPEARLPLGEVADLSGGNTRDIAFAVNVGVGANLGAIIGPKFFGEIRYAFDVTGFVEDNEVTNTESSGTYGLNGLFVTVGVGL